MSQVTTSSHEVFTNHVSVHYLWVLSTHIISQVLLLAIKYQLIMSRVTTSGQKVPKIVSQVTSYVHNIST